MDHYYVLGIWRVLYWRCSVTATKDTSTTTSTSTASTWSQSSETTSTAGNNTFTTKIRAFSADDHSVRTAPQSPSEHLTVDDASVTPFSRKSSHCSRGDKTHFSPYDDYISDDKFPRSDTEISFLGSDKWYNPDHVYPDDEEFKSDRPSTTSSLRSRSDRRTTKFEKTKDMSRKDRRPYGRK